MVNDELTVKFADFAVEVRDGTIFVKGISHGPLSPGDKILVGVHGDVAINGVPQRARRSGVGLEARTVGWLRQRRVAQRVRDHLHRFAASETLFGLPSTCGCGRDVLGFVINEQQILARKPRGSLSRLIDWLIWFHRPTS